MSAETINQRYISQFLNQVHVMAQQSTSRFRPLCVQIPMDADETYYDRLGPVEAREVTGRNSDSLPANIENSRRRIGRREFEITLWVDQFDVEGVLTNPQGDYAAQITAGMERQYDVVCYDALFADVQTGRKGENTVTATTDGVVTVNATAGLTLPKLLEAKQNFFDREIGRTKSGQMEPIRIAMGISGDEHTTLLNIQQLTSGDYTRQFTLEDGEIQRAVGIDLIPFGASSSRPILPVSGGVRTSFVLASRGLAVAIGREWQLTVKDRPDKINVTQIQITGVMGAVRTEGARVQKFTTTDL